MSAVRILAVAGSLRSESYNRALLQAAADAPPPGVEVHVFARLREVPLFDEDAEHPPPPGVARLRREVAAADALLIATPEYNQSVPGVVKNMIDWLSRGEPGLAGKPVAVTGATPGPWGTRIAQTVLRQMLLSCQALVLPAPTLFVRDAGALLDGDGRLQDAVTVARLRDLVEALAAWSAAVGVPRHRVLAG